MEGAKKTTGNAGITHFPLYNFFEQLQKSEGFLGGIEEYQLLLEVLMNEVSHEKLYYLKSKESLLNLCKLLWLKPKQNQQVFEQLFDENWEERFIKKDSVKDDSLTPPKQPPINNKDKNKNKDTTNTTNQTKKGEDDDKIYLNFGAGNTGESVEQSHTETNTYFHFVKNYIPFQQREISQAWRFFQHKKSIGGSHEIDIIKTIKKITTLGVLDEPVFKTIQQNNAKLITFIEHKGGMTAFKNLAIALAQSAADSAGIENQVYFFQNVPHKIRIQNTKSAYCLYLDETETKYTTLRKILSQSKQAILIISDAGATSNYLDIERLNKTVSFLKEIKKYTHKIAWLNPMPSDRWEDTTAAEIEKLVSSFEASPLGLKKALNILNGKAK